MIAGLLLDPDRAAALDRFMADVEALDATQRARDTIAELLVLALHETPSGDRWRSLYRAVRLLLAGASVSVRNADPYERLKSFLAENIDLDTDARWEQSR